MPLINITKVIQDASLTADQLLDAKFDIYHVGTERRITLYEDSDLTILRANPVEADQQTAALHAFMVEAECRLVVRDRFDAVVADIEAMDAVRIERFSHTFRTVDALLTDQTLSLDAGTGFGPLRVDDLLWVLDGNFTYRVAADTATNAHLETAGGLKLYVISDERGYNVKAFGAVGDGVTDDTTAFELAQKAGVDPQDDLRTGGIAFVPVGRYALTEMKVYDRGGLTGEGYELSTLIQMAADKPAIDMTSDFDSGQILSARIERLGIEGHASSTAPAFCIRAHTPFAIHRCHIDVTVRNSYQAIFIEASDDNNFYGNKLQLYSVGSSDTAFVTNGGVYNRYDLFLTGCASGRACSLGGFHNHYERLVADGQIASAEQSSIYYDPTIEGWNGATLPAGEALQKYTGFNQMLLQPTVNLSASAVATSGAEFAFQLGQQAVLFNPRVMSAGPAHPIKSTFNSPITLVGPGQNNCTNKIEAIFDGSTPQKNPNIIRFVGEHSAWTDNPGTAGEVTVQHEQPTQSTTINTHPRAGLVLIDSPTDLGVINLRMDFNFTASDLTDNRLIRVRSVNGIGFLNCVSPAGANVSELPSALSPGGWFTCIYRAATNTYHLVSQSGVQSDGTTGGAGSAGAGNQYVAMTIAGTTYKVLHDGTL